MIIDLTLNIVELIIYKLLSIDIDRIIYGFNFYVVGFLKTDQN